MAILKYPYTNLHELNLDWLIEQLNSQDGPVRSVNGKSGIVTLTGEDIERSENNPETVATALQTQGTAIQTVRNQIGTIPLPTTAQTITGAIAEHETDIININTKIGSTALPTIAQTLTGAIKENSQDIADQDDLIGSTALPTTAQTITGAIAEHETDILGLTTGKANGLLISISGGDSKVVSLGNNFRGTLLISSAYSNCAGIANFYCSGAGVAGYHKLTALTDITFNASSNTIEIAPVNGINATLIIHASTASVS